MHDNLSVAHGSTHSAWWLNIHVYSFHWNYTIESQSQSLAWLTASSNGFKKHTRHRSSRFQPKIVQLSQRRNGCIFFEIRVIIDLKPPCFMVQQCAISTRIVSRCTMDIFGFCLTSNSSSDRINFKNLFVCSQLSSIFISISLLVV